MLCIPLDLVIWRFELLDTSGPLIFLMGSIWRHVSLIIVIKWVIHFQHCHTHGRLFDLIKLSCVHSMLFSYLLLLLLITVDKMWWVTRVTILFNICSISIGCSYSSLSYKPLLNWSIVFTLILIFELSRWNLSSCVL